MVATAGRESSAILLISVVCLSISIFISQLVNESVFPVTKLAIFVSLICMLIPAILSMIYAYAKRKDNTFVSYLADGTETVEANIQNGVERSNSIANNHTCSNNSQHGNDFVDKVKRHFPNVGLYVFGTGSIVLDILAFVSVIECIYTPEDILRHIGNGTSVMCENKGDYTLKNISLSNSAVSEAIFHFAKVVFFIVQVTFLVKFSMAKFHKIALMKTVTFSILAVNVSVWMYCFLKEAKRIYKIESKHFVNIEIETKFINKEVSSEIIVDARYFDIHATNCICGNTTLGVFMESAEKYLFPFTMEYSLIAAGILYSIWKNAATITTHNAHVGNQESSMGGSTIEVHETQNINAASLESQASAQLDSVGTNIDACLTETTLLLTNTASVTQCQSRSLSRTRSRIGLMFNIGFVFTIIHMVIEGLLYDEELYHTMLPIHYGFQITFYIANVGFATKAFFIVKKLPNMHTEYDEEDILLLISSVGMFLFIFFSMISAFSMIFNSYYPPTVYPAMPYLVAGDAILNLVETIVQTIFLIQASRLATLHNVPKKEISYLTNAIAFLAICNFGKWAMDSFIELQSIDSSPVQGSYYHGTWNIIVLVTYPLCIFYRFHSVSMMIKIIP